MTLCLSNYGDKCCKLYVLMFGLWLFSRFTPPLNRVCLQVHGTAVCVPTLLAAILENNQTEVGAHYTH